MLTIKYASIFFIVAIFCGSLNAMAEEAVPSDFFKDYLAIQQKRIATETTRKLTAIKSEGPLEGITDPQPALANEASAEEMDHVYGQQSGSFMGAINLVQMLAKLTSENADSKNMVHSGLDPKDRETKKKLPLPFMSQLKSGEDIEIGLFNTPFFTFTDVATSGEVMTEVPVSISRNADNQPVIHIQFNDTSLFRNFSMNAGAVLLGGKKGINIGGMGVENLNMQMTGDLHFAPRF